MDILLAIIVALDQSFWYRVDDPNPELLIRFCSRCSSDLMLVRASLLISKHAKQYSAAFDLPNLGDPAE